jgi:uncharacterized membrane protein YbhN (UPF0104 family)
LPARGTLRAYGPLLLGVVGIALMLLLVDLDGIGPALSAFDLRLVPVLLALAVADYALRYMRWHLLAAEATGSRPPLVADIAVFLAANTLLLTPARAGDFTRSLWARDLFGTPISRTAPVPLLERVADVAVMVGLAGLGALLFGTPGWIALAVPAGVVSVALLAWAGLRMLPAPTWLGGVTVKRPALSAFFDTLRVLWRPRPLAIAFGLGLGAWAIECVMFFVVLTGLGLDASPRLLGVAAFVYPTATLAGSISLLPGGLGIAEASTTGLTVSLTSAAASQAVAAALLIRLAIVGFGVVTGLPGLVYVSRARSTVVTREAPQPIPQGRRQAA